MFWSTTLVDVGQTIMIPPRVSGEVSSGHGTVKMEFQKNGVQSNPIIVGGHITPLCAHRKDVMVTVMYQDRAAFGDAELTRYLRTKGPEIGHIILLGEVENTTLGAGGRIGHLFARSQAYDARPSLWWH